MSKRSSCEGCIAVDIPSRVREKVATELGITCVKPERGEPRTRRGHPMLPGIVSETTTTYITCPLVRDLDVHLVRARINQDPRHKLIERITLGLIDQEVSLTDVIGAVRDNQTPHYDNPYARYNSIRGDVDVDVTGIINCLTAPA